MASSNAVLIKYEELRSLAFGSISGAYAGVGSPFANPVRMICLDNLTDEDLVVSFNGTTNHTPVPARSGRVLDYCSNTSMQSGVAEQQVGTRVYVKAIGGAPTSGSFYVTVIYVDTV